MFKVIKLRTNGKRHPREESLRADGLYGDVIIGTDSRRGEQVRFAELVEQINTARPPRIIYRLEHPQIVSMTKAGMLIRGVEINSQSQEMIQEWWCKYES